MSNRTRRVFSFLPSPILHHCELACTWPVRSEAWIVSASPSTLGLFSHGFESKRSHAPMAASELLLPTLYNHSQFMNPNLASLKAYLRAPLQQKHASKPGNSQEGRTYHDRILCTFVPDSERFATPGC